AGFKAEKGGRQAIGLRQFLRAQAIFVDQEIGELRLEALAARWDRAEQAREVERHVPGALAVVEDERQHGRETLGDFDLSSPDQLDEEKGEIPLETQGHDRIGSGLEFQEEIEIAPALCPVGPAQAPNHVALAQAQTRADVAIANPLQGREVETLGPFLLEEPSEEIL